MRIPEKEISPILNRGVVKITVLHSNLSKKQRFKVELYWKMFQCVKIVITTNAFPWQPFLIDRSANFSVFFFAVIVTIFCC